eukprot:g28635.t1
MTAWLILPVSLSAFSITGIWIVTAPARTAGGRLAELRLLRRSAAQFQSTPRTAPAHTAGGRLAVSWPLHGLRLLLIWPADNV